VDKHIGVMGFFIAEDIGFGPETFLPPEPVAPNWAAIATWPSLEAPIVEAQPNPNRRVTAIVLDDSGSMGTDMAAAKQAVVDALGAMDDEDRVAVVALNAGTVLSFTTVSDARATLPSALHPIFSDGSTPLTGAIEQAKDLLEQEASAARSFGTFRMIVTTDGEADNGEALDATVRSLAAETPIQLTTIGIGIGGGHVLRRSDIGSFVDVADVSALDSYTDPTDFQFLPSERETRQIAHRSVALPATIGQQWPLDNLAMARRWWKA